jgi:hypothetical protein
MKKAELRKLIIRIYGFYPPEDSSYEFLIRLRSMLVKYGKPKRSYLQAKGKSPTESHVFDPPQFTPFSVEEEETVKSTPNIIYPMSLTFGAQPFVKNLTSISDNQTTGFPVYYEDKSVSPTTNRKRILSLPESVFKKTKNN